MDVKRLLTVCFNFGFSMKTANRVAIIFILICLFSACGPGSVKDEKSIFVYNEAVGISSLDPAFAKNLANIWACNQLYNGLVGLDDKLRVVPAIAESWEISPDGRIYTFHLRDDVFFHDDDAFKNGRGRKVVAQDVLYSFRRLFNPVIASPGAWVFNNVGLIDETPAFNAPNDSTFMIRLKHSFPPFLAILSMKYCSIIPREAIDRYGDDFRKHPVGTGPFRFRMWKEGVKLVLRKNPHYFEFDDGQRLPYLDGVAVTFLKDNQSAFLEFVQGKLDFLSGLHPSYKDELLTRSGRLNPKYKDRFKLQTQPYLNTEYLGILIDSNIQIVRESPLSLMKLRQAINYGFDRAKMIRYLRNGIGTPGIYGIIPEGLPSFDTTASVGYNYRPDISRKLLREAGFPDGEGLPDINLHTTSEYLDLCKFIQHQLSEVGIPIRIEVHPGGALREMKAQAKLNFFRASWIADYPDAENYLSLFYSKNFCPDGPNYTHFSSTKVDSLYEQSLKIMEDTSRIRLYRKINEIVMQEAPVVILYYDQVLRFSQKNITGLGSNPINLLDLRRVKKIAGEKQN